MSAIHSEPRQSQPTENGKGVPTVASWRRSLGLGWRVVSVRLRLLLVLAAAFLVVGKWDALRNYWDAVTRGGSDTSQPVSLDTEYFCPMCPGVRSDWPSKCPVCNMALVRRKKGDAVPLPEGVVARMQFSPYRLQLAGVRTSPIEYRPLLYEVRTAGVVEAGRQPSRPSVTAEVFEKDLPLVAVGRKVAVTSDVIPALSLLAGVVVNVARQPTSGSRTFRLRAEIEDLREELGQGTIVRVIVQVPAAQMEWHTRALTEEWRTRSVVESLTSSVLNPTGAAATGGDSLLRRAVGEVFLQRGLVLAVPETSVVDTGAQKVVYVETGPGMFDGVEVVLGPRCGDFFPVLRGLEAGQRVVTAGAFLLDAETRLNPSLAASYFGATRRSGGPVSAERPPAVSDKDRLSAADEALVQRQKTCPVTHEPLGSMGAPYRVDLNGRKVFLCCKACEKELRRNPEKYLAKLPPP